MFIEGTVAIGLSTKKKLGHAAPLLKVVLGFSVEVFKSMITIYGQ